MKANATTRSLARCLLVKRREKKRKKKPPLPTPHIHTHTFSLQIKPTIPLPPPSRQRFLLRHRSRPSTPPTITTRQPQRSPTPRAIGTIHRNHQLTTSATEGASCSSGGILGFALVTSHALPSVAGGVAGVAWLGDLALAGAAAAGGHDGDGFWGVLGLGGREGWWCLFSELRGGFLLVFCFSSFKGRRDCRCGRFCAVAFLVVDGDWTCVACLGSRCRE